MHDFYLIDIDYASKDNATVIQLYGKMDGKNAVVSFSGFLPYIYALSSDLDRAKKSLEALVVKKEDLEIRAVKVEKASRIVLGEKTDVLKVYLTHPQDVVEFREIAKTADGVDDIREYDIPFTRRFLMDFRLSPFRVIKVKGEKKEENGIVRIDAERIEPDEKEHSLDELKVLSFDIEVYNPETVPRVGRDPMIMASFAEPGGWKRVISWRATKEKVDYLEVVEDEKALIEAIVRTVKERDPDIIVTYNGDQFDFEYLKERAKLNKVKLQLGRGSDLSFVHRGRFNAAKMKGRAHIDLYHVVFNIIRRNLSLPKYTLETLSEKYLEVPKRPLAIDIWKAWDTDVDILVKYSGEDAVVTAKLAMEFLPLQVEFAKLTRSTLFDCSRMTSGQLVEILLLNKAADTGQVAPNKPKYGEKKARFESGSIKGAYVKEPKKGIQDDLAVFDFRSLYPTIIVSFNIDPTVMDCGCCGSGEGRHFCGKRKGFIPEILKEVLERRGEIKKALKKKQDKRLDAQQYALKLLANSFYGFFGYMGARWYSKECAEEITRLGREYIQKTIKEAEVFGFEVVYSDTDSLFVTGKSLETTAPEFLALINSKLPGIMNLELEGLYKRGLFVTKKRYALIGKDGKITTKGLEVVRRDWAKIAKDTQQKVLRTVLEGKPEAAADIVKEVIARLKSGKVLKDELVIYTQMIKSAGEYKNDSPHVAVAKKIIKAGGRVETGTLIGFIVCKGVGRISERSKSYESAKEGEYDASYYIENQVLPPVTRILEVLGYDIDAFVGNQKKLFDF